MIPDSYRQLFDTLYERTSRGEINWSRSARTDVFLVSLSGFSITINKGFDDSEGEEFISIRLINDQGRDADGFWVSENESDWPRATALYDEARRKADRIDITLKKVMEELSKPGPVGEPPDPEDDLPF